MDSTRDPIQRAVLFDWGDTLMRDIPEYRGPMAAWPRVEAVPGADETLARLYPTWRIGLATNAADSDETQIRAALARVDLDHWVERVYSFRSVGARKPAPEFYAFLLADLGLPPGAVVLVGDHREVDVLGALRAGLSAVWYNPNSGETIRAARGRTVHRLTDLPDVLEALVS
jgi:putative hydrolase of the HAD superfamily